jgi:hypothetical protein
MNSGPSLNQDRDESARYIDQVCDAYVFDESTGIYKPRAPQEGQQERPQGAVEIGGQPLRTETKVTRDWFDTLLKCIGLVISFATLVLLVLTVYYAHNQWTEAKRTADASVCAATAATRSVRNAEISFRTDERAWVVIGDIIRLEKAPAYYPNNPGKYFGFKFTPKNIGKTVAREVRIHLISPEFDIPFTIDRRRIQEAEDKFSLMTLYPNYPGPQSLAPNANSSIPIEVAARDPDGTKYNFILGRIDYVDAFSVRHWTHFCFFVKNSDGELGHCEYGNDQDSNPETPSEIPKK